MGYFASLIVCVLNRKNGQLEPQTTVTTFRDRTYVSWESGELPETEWAARGTKSIYFKKGGKILSEIRYHQDLLVTPVSTGILRKRAEFNFEASYRPFSTGVYHLVLPELCVPQIATLGGRKPQHIKKVQNRVALTWTFGHGISVKFTFRAASQSEFEQFKTRGVPIRMKISPSFKASLKRDLTAIENEGKDVVAKALAEFLRP
jgi:hypothetical protein